MKKCVRIMGILSDLDFQQIQGGQRIKIPNSHVWGEGNWLVIGVVAGFSSFPGDWNGDFILNEFNLLASLNLLEKM